MGFSDLRVINQDRVEAGRGFGMHPHRDMEIFSLVLDGELEHKDNLGNTEIIGPYQLQKITAGTGVMHSEYNPSTTDEVHFLQIWIVPDKDGYEPGYVIKDFADAPTGKLTPMLTPDGADDSAKIHQDAAVYLGRLTAGSALDYAPEPGRKVWVQVLNGAITINGEKLQDGDGVAIVEEDGLNISAEHDSEFLLFDLK
jgi:redox-sensitive bicupin YhaK (pirin superfamily)